MFEENDGERKGSRLPSKPAISFVSTIKSEFSSLQEFKGFEFQIKFEGVRSLSFECSTQTFFRSN